MAIKINYEAPYWYGKRFDYAKITDIQLRSMREVLVKTEKDNTDLYNTYEKRHQTLMREARDLYGAKSPVLKAMATHRIPKPQSFADDFNKLVKKVERARRIAEQEAAAVAHINEVWEHRSEGAQRGWETRKRREIEREAYVEGLPQSD